VIVWTGFSVQQRAAWDLRIVGISHIRRIGRPAGHTDDPKRHDDDSERLGEEKKARQKLDGCGNRTQLVEKEKCNQRVEQRMNLRSAQAPPDKNAWDEGKTTEHRPQYARCLRKDPMTGK